MKVCKFPTATPDQDFINKIDPKRTSVIDLPLFRDENQMHGNLPTGRRLEARRRMQRQANCNGSSPTKKHTAIIVATG